MLTTILGSVISAVFGGGATGLLGVWMQRYFDMKSKALDLQVLELKHKHELALRDKDMLVMQEEWKGRERVAAEEGAASVEVAALQALAKSYDADQARYTAPDAQRQSRAVRWMFGVVDTVRGLTRPVLTAYLVYVSSALYAEVQALAVRVGAQLTAAQVHDLLLQIITALLYMTVTAVVWWFGSRPPKKAGDK